MKTLSLFYVIGLCLHMASGYVIAFVQNCGALPNTGPWAFNRNITILPEAWSRLYIVRGDAILQSGKSYAEIINSGLGLIAKNHCERETIATLDFVSVFPLFLNSPWPEGQPTFWDYRNTFDAQNHPTPEQAFGHTTVLMVPKFSNTPPTVMALEQIYGTYLGTNFYKVDENQCWILLKRI